MIALGALALLAVTVIQPCAPFRNTHVILSGTPCGQPNVVRLFHSEGESRNIDPRLLVAVALAATGGASRGCGLTNLDPFTDINNHSCSTYPNLSEAVIAYSAHISQDYVHNGHQLLDYIGDHEHWQTVGVVKYFTDLLGRPTVPLLYSSSCCGDCNRNQSVDINELIYLISLTICSEGCAPISSCALGDANHDGRLFITDLIVAVLSALDPCPGH